MVTPQTRRLLTLAQLSIVNAGRAEARADTEAAVRKFAANSTELFSAVRPDEIRDAAEIAVYMLDVMDWLERPTPGDAPPAHLPAPRGKPTLRLVEPGDGDLR